MFKHDLSNVFNLRNQKLPSIVEELASFITLASVFIVFLAQNKGVFIEQVGGLTFIEGELERARYLLTLDENLF